MKSRALGNEEVTVDILKAIADLIIQWLFNFIIDIWVNE